MLSTVDVTRVVAVLDKLAVELMLGPKLVVSLEKVSLELDILEVADVVNVVGLDVVTEFKVVLGLVEGSEVEVSLRLEILDVADVPKLVVVDRAADVVPREEVVVSLDTGLTSEVVEASELTSLAEVENTTEDVDDAVLIGRFVVELEPCVEVENKTLELTVVPSIVVELVDTSTLELVVYSVIVLERLVDVFIEIDDVVLSDVDEVSSVSE